MKKLRQILSLIAVLAMAVLASCSKDDSSVNIPVEGVTIEPASLSFVVGTSESQTLKAMMLPENASNKSVTWESGDPTVAKVGVDNGIVTIVDGATVGQTAIITATTKDGGFTAHCTVTVTTAPVRVQSVSIPQAKLLMLVDDSSTEQLSVEITPTTATDKSVTWTSSNNDVVNVDETTGVVTISSSAQVGQSATITATTNDGRKTANCEVSVVNPVKNSDFYYSDFTWSTTLDTNKTVIGVVFHANSNKKSGLVVSVDEKTNVQWADTAYTIVNIYNDDPFGTMDRIATYESGFKYFPAFEWVRNKNISLYGTYSDDDYEEGLKNVWYLPSRRELKILFSGKDYSDNTPEYSTRLTEVNEALSAANKKEINGNSSNWYWSSDQYNTTPAQAWRISFYDGPTSPVRKTTSEGCHARAVLAF